MSTPQTSAENAVNERVVVAMSGGVDSSVVAALLTEQGYDAVGISMRLYRTGTSGPAKGCCSPDDLFDARAVATTLGMPFYVVNYEGRGCVHYLAVHLYGFSVLLSYCVVRSYSSFCEPCVFC